MSADVQRLLARLRDWLACADPVCNGDLIFALAGRQGRKIFALDLFSQGRAPHLVLSVSRFEIRRFSKLPFPVSVDLLRIAAPIPPPRRHFFVSLEGGRVRVVPVRRARLGTLSEVRALAAWLREHPDIASLLVVSSATHLRRVRMCCRVLLPKTLQVHLLGMPEENPSLERDPRTMVWAELVKLFGYWVVLRFFP